MFRVVIFEESKNGGKDKILWGDTCQFFDSNPRVSISGSKEVHYHDYVGDKQFIARKPGQFIAVDMGTGWERI